MTLIRCAVGGVSVLIPVLYLLRLIHCRVCSGRDSCFDFCVLSDDIDTLIHYRMCGGWGVLPGRREVGLGLSGEAVCGQPVRQGILPLYHSKTTR